MATDDTIPSLGETLDAPAGAPGADPGLTVTREQPGRYQPPGPDQAANELGRGGIGRVLVVRDAHLSREVALKELLSRPAPGSAGSGRDALVLTRFLREARITGQLEHPGIVPVYELGQRPDGTLYYTMKVVRGRTLAEALADCDGLSDRLALLKHFADLCNAMAYAHARGVIHRDLKPGNVMLGEFGETVLLDWGLARPVEGEDYIASVDAGPASIEDPAATAEGSILGTPLYMSPEQARGEADLGPQTDVWSLGVMLYELLTGERPFTGRTAIAVLTAVTTGTPTPIRELAPGAPPELAAVAERAISRDRDVRYANASELAAEVTAFLIGDRVRAYRYGLRDVLARFAKRHVVSLSVAGVAAALLIGLGIWAHLGVRAERDRAMGAEAAARSAAADARAAQAEAVTARDQAEGLVQYMVGDLRQTLEPLGRLDLLDRVVDRVAEHVDADGAGEATRDPARARSRAGTQFLIARLAEARGRTADARTAAEEALKLRAGLAAAGPSPADVRDLALSELQVAALDRQTGDRASAQQRIEAALERLAPIADAGDAEARMARSAGRIALGNLRATGGDLDAAEALYRQALATREALVRAAPEETRWQVAAAEAHDQIGDARFDRGELDDAAAAYGAARALRGALVEAHPDNLQWVRELGVSHEQLGDVEFARGRTREALGEWNQAMDRFTRAYAANPTHLGWRRDAAIGRLKMADALGALGQTEAAARALEGVVRDLDGIVAQSPRDTWVRDLNLARWRRADLLMAMGRAAEAGPLVDAALRDAGRLAEQVPDSVRHQHDLAVARIKRGELSARTGDPIAAAMAWRTAGRMLGRIAQRDPQNAAVARDRAIARERLAAVLARPDLDRDALWRAVQSADAAADETEKAGGGSPPGGTEVVGGTPAADKAEGLDGVMVAEASKASARPQSHARGKSKAEPARARRPRPPADTASASGSAFEPEREAAPAMAAAPPPSPADDRHLDPAEEVVPSRKAAAKVVAEEDADEKPAMAQGEPEFGGSLDDLRAKGTAGGGRGAGDPMSLLEDPLLGDAAPELADAPVRPWVGAAGRDAPRAPMGEGSGR